MFTRIMLVPVGSGVGLTTISLGLVQALDQNNMNVGFFKPISQPKPEDTGPEKSTEIIRTTTTLNPPNPLSAAYAEKKYSDGQQDLLLEEIVASFENYAEQDKTVIIEGLVQTQEQNYTVRLNKKIAAALGARIIFVATFNKSSAQVEELLDITAAPYGGVNSKHVLGCIFNKIGAPNNAYDIANAKLSQDDLQKKQSHIREKIKNLPAIKQNKLALLGVVSWQFDLLSPRVKDLALYLKTQVLSAGDMEYRRIRSIHFCARTVGNIMGHLIPNALLVTPGDRSDIIIAACLSAMNGTKIGAILLTGGLPPEPNILKLCQSALDSGVPLLMSDMDSWQMAVQLQGFNVEVPIDDIQRIEKVKNHTASCLSKSWIEGLVVENDEQRQLSPAAFRYLLAKQAKMAGKTIVLPEGNEPRTIVAASLCAQRQIAKCVLIGNKQEILQIAENQGVILDQNVTIIEPDNVIDRYIDDLVDARKHKGMTPVIAKEQLKDTVMLATMMLDKGEVDGLVSGAVNTTANTIRPALQIIKTAPNSSLVSSIFFMLLPEQVFVYGDCAINPDPDAEQLADIAIQSADSAKAFGIHPKVAMISYSTGSSGHGDDVEKVRKATVIAQTKRPDLIIDGPLQYDAAVTANVAAKKAPNSPVAGQATVFVFPDLNTGNTTYKAVQRSADLISIGPMLQGMNKPVNDLSRGALVEDIVYTIALTAIQATQ